MGRKGSITIFLALMLSLMLSLVCASIQSVQMAAARTQILNGMDIGLYSLFGQYDRFLLKEYDLFFLEGSGGSGTLNLAGVYDNLESYVTPVLKQNSQKLSIRQGGFTGYRLATDESGEVFYRQAVTFMKDTLGLQGISEIMDRLTNKEERTREAEQNGQQAEQNGAMESYEEEMNSASKSSAQASQNTAENQGGDSADFSDGSGETQVSPETKTEVVNPIPIIKRIRRMGILDLVVPASKGVSGNEISLSSLVSGRKLQQGMQMVGAEAADETKTSRLLFQAYLNDHLGNYMDPGKSGLRYQMEYLLFGKAGDAENLKSVANQLLMIREGVNFTALIADGVKRAQIHTLALAIAAGFLVPPAAVAIEAALIFCWSFAESILDVRELFHGGHVPLVKTSADWQLSLENLPKLLEGLDSNRRDCAGGMSYEDYLQVLLLAKTKAELLKRGMDMTELNVKKESGRENFKLDCCIEALEVSMDVEANRKKTYTVIRQYRY